MSAHATIHQEASGIADPSRAAHTLSRPSRVRQLSGGVSVSVIVATLSMHRPFVAVEDMFSTMFRNRLSMVIVQLRCTYLLY